MALGIPSIRQDAIAKVTGKARFTDDLTMRGMRFAQYVRSPIAHGKVKSIDVTEALALPGVEAIFTYKDVPQILFPTAGHAYSLDPAKRDTADRLLLTNHVRHHGDGVAIVVAKDKMTADKAVRLVKVDYEILPIMLTAKEALAPDAIALHPNGNLLKQHEILAGGNLDEAMDQADQIVESDYHTAIAQHCHMETVISYAYMEHDNHVIIVSSTQIPHIVRRIVGQALGLPWSNIRVIKPYLGGGFGNKQDVLEEPMCAFLTMRLGGIPIKIELTREENFLGSRTRHSFDIHGKMGVKKDGTITGYRLESHSNTGAYASHGHSIVSAAANKISYLYPRVVFSYLAQTYYSNLPNAGAMRGYGAPQAIFALDSLVEEAAHSIGMDPVEMRLKNVAKLGDTNPVNHKEIKSCGMTECLEKGRELFDWKNKYQAYQHQDGEIRRGIGVACFSYGANTYPSGVEIAGARLALNQDGTVNLQTGATEIGQGSDTVFAQMAAETLGMPFKMVRTISTQDTDITPFDPGAFASRESYVASAAIHEASIELKRKILEHASFMSGQPAGSLDLIDGKIVFIKRPDYVLYSIADIAMDAIYQQDYGGQITAESSHKTRTNPPAFGCTFVDIEVDIPLCRITIKDILNLHDSGRILNPQLAAGQVEGGMAMGIGGALFEEMLIEPGTGLIRNGNLLDYKFPTIMDVPPLRHAFVETWEPQSTYGNKSLGEPPILTPSPAIRNAVWMATGVKIDIIPITPRVLYQSFIKHGLLKGIDHV